jgi:hypothetical protein
MLDVYGWMDGWMDGTWHGMASSMLAALHIPRADSRMPPSISRASEHLPGPRKVAYVQQAQSQQQAGPSSPVLVCGQVHTCVCVTSYTLPQWGRAGRW